jgi:HAD superfamily hydrolase (TIGR01509 family)
MAHYNSYKKVFENYNKQFLNMDEWNNIIMNDNIDNYIRTIFDAEQFNIIKREKLQFLRDEPIVFTKNSEYFLKFLIQNQFNFCIVTNTNKETVDIFKHKLPLLTEINNWVYRHEYNLSKPDPECYALAKHKYYNKEPYMVVFEDSMVGYNAAKAHTDLVYIFNNKHLFNNYDCYLFDDFLQVLH